MTADNDPKGDPEKDTPPSTPDPKGEPEKDPPPSTDRLPDDHPVVKALAKANEEAKTLRHKVKEFEDAGKSDLDKANSAAAEATKRAEEAELRVLRLEVAAAKGLTPTQAKRIVGATREELEADADELVAEFGGGQSDTDNTQPNPLQRKPNEQLRGGGDPTQPAATDLADVVKKVRRF